MSWESIAARLAQQVEALEAEVWSLREQLRAPDEKLAALREHLGLRPTGAVILLRLYQAGGRYVTTEQLVVTTQTRADDGDNLIKVQIHYMRKQIGRETIAVLPGTGYKLSKQGLALVGAALQGDRNAMDAARLSTHDPVAPIGDPSVVDLGRHGARKNGCDVERDRSAAIDRRRAGACDRAAEGGAKHLAG